MTAFLKVYLARFVIKCILLCLGSSSNIFATSISANTSNTSSSGVSSSGGGGLGMSKLFFDSNDKKLATTGNIFERRDDWSILNRLPINKQNSIHVRLEDEGPYGNDETRCFVLSHFSSLNLKELSCVFCDCSMPIYDRFPLVDGTLFVSPVAYDRARSVPSIVSNKQQYINAVCLKCLLGEDADHAIRCLHCGKLWQDCGSRTFQVGTLYKFDLFAALPCCQARLNCAHCGHPLLDIDEALSSVHRCFSSYSEQAKCPGCHQTGFLFLRNLDSIYQQQNKN